jgi:hypothetical protein
VDPQQQGLEMDTCAWKNTLCRAGKTGFAAPRKRDLPRIFAGADHFANHFAAATPNFKSPKLKKL